MPSQSLPVHVFETVLTKILEFSSEKATSPADVIATVRLSQMLLQNAPEGPDSKFLALLFAHRLLQER